MAHHVPGNVLVERTAKLKEFSADGKYCDFVVNVGTKVFKCHKLVLLTASAFFEDYFKDVKENSEYYMTVTDCGESVFEEILRFIYSGDIAFTRDSIYDILRACEPFKLRQLNSVDELGAGFILQQESTIPGTLDAFSEFVTPSPKRIALTNALCCHILDHLDEYANDEEFRKFNSTQWDALLNQRWYLRRGMETKFLRAIFRWLDDQPSRARDEYYLRSVFERIQFEYQSDDYNRRLSSIYSEGRLQESEEVETCVDLTPTSLPALHVYMRDPEDHKTYIFSVSRDLPRWRESHVIPFTSEFMASIGVGGRLYSLNYSSLSYLFEVRTNVADFDPRILKQPPAMYDAFELCNIGKHIYMNSFGGPVIWSNKRNFSFIGVYEYNTEINKWFPIYSLMGDWKGFAVTAYREQLYVVGRDDANPQPWNRATMYTLDTRVSPWRKLKPSNHGHDTKNMTCCGHEGRIYLCSGETTDTLTVESYDVRAEKWESVGQMDGNSFYVNKLLSFENWMWAVGQSTTNKLSHIETYNTYTDSWSPSPILETIQNFRPNIDFHFMDSVIFQEDYYVFRPEAS